MNYYYDCCEDCDRKSKADEIIDDAKNKLVDLIWEQVKGELENRKKINDYLSKRVEEIQNNYGDLLNKKITLEKENEHLKAELEQQTRFITRIPAVLGERVYFMHKWDEGKILCATCGGTGKVTVQDKRFGETTIKCPTCKGIKSVKYPKFQVDSAWLVGIKIINKVGKSRSYLQYYLEKAPVKPTRCGQQIIKTTEIFKETDDLHKIVTERNQIAKTAAEMKFAVNVEE